MSKPDVRRAAGLRRLLGPALVVVLATDLVGGLLDVAAGRSSLGSAWSSSATLCAPWPMIAFQVAASLLIHRRRGVASSVAAVLLTLACAVSLASGFFDGQLGRADLAVGERVFQGWLLAATGVLGAAAAASLSGSDAPRSVSSDPDGPTAGAQKPKRSRSADNQAATGS